MNSDNNNLKIKCVDTINGKFILNWIYHIVW